MDLVFLIIAAATLAGAIAAMTLRNLVHCALCMVVAFAGIAAIYLQLNAQFVGFAQVMVYVGAVAILIVFAVLLTRGNDAKPGAKYISRSWISGLVIALMVFGGLRYAITHSTKLEKTAVPAAPVTVKQIGDQLMTKYVLPLEALGLLLTAAMIGAVIISMRDREDDDQADAAPKEGSNEGWIAPRRSATLTVAAPKEP